MERLQNPEQRLRHRRQQTIVIGQLESRRDRIERTLLFRTDVETCGEALLGAGGYRLQSTDVLALITRRRRFAAEGRGFVRRRNDRGDEIMLQHCDPAAGLARVVDLLVEILEAHFLETVFGFSCLLTVTTETH